VIPKRLPALLLAAIFVFALTGVTYATEATKKINVSYNSIKVVVDGKVLALPSTQAPFIMGGTTYVPLRYAAEALNSLVAWQGQAKTITITGGSQQTKATQAQLAEKDQELVALRAQLATLQNELKNCEADESVSDINELEDELVEDYDEIEDVQLENLRITGGKNEVEVKAEVVTDSDWNNLSYDDIEDWIKDVVDEIHDSLDEGTEVNGEIRDADDHDLLVEFYDDGDDNLDIDFYDKHDDDNDSGSASPGEVADVEDDLDGDSFDVGGIEFSISAVSYDFSNDIIKVEFIAEDNHAKDDWGDLSSATKKGDVEDICKEIAETFEDDADANPEYVTANFYDENFRFIEGFEYDVAYRTLDGD